ncbi:prenyltransferase/squalene oxidase repeat-containing protein [Desulforegula conservatrix]|uniref:hypothetical protein n=1 Tax=Desulforegula conservatrix TaxID=153026 RepID=UPI0004083768|nr:hypothetical protein [Desulforegula conservatrix]
MTFKTSKKPQGLIIDVDTVASSIACTQKENGEIPWSVGEKTDPWDMVESIMGLTIGGLVKEARKGFEWLLNEQLPNGSWYASYINGIPEDRTMDTNMSTYLAVGALHHYTITGDKDYLARLWPAVKAGIDFAMRMQAPDGEIHWAQSPEGKTDPMALLTGSSSVFMSTKCAITMAGILGHDCDEWMPRLNLLGDSLKNRRHSYNVTKSRFSMDWFYPILAGAVTGEEAQKRLHKYWKKFVVEGMGIRCVSDQPWVTIAESAEFVLALHAMGNVNQAEIVFNWIHGRTYDDGSYWCGFTFPDMVIWPEDKLTWTNAVVLMAADALYGLTPASNFFTHDFWRSRNLCW